MSLQVEGRLLLWAPSVRGENPVRSHAASSLTEDGQGMLADAGWLEHKAQSSANWQFREVSLIVCNRHLPEGASTSFPFVSFDSISDEHPCRFPIQTLVAFPHHLHRPLHFLLPLPPLNSTSCCTVGTGDNPLPSQGRGQHCSSIPRHPRPQTVQNTPPVLLTMRQSQGLKRQPTINTW